MIDRAALLATLACLLVSACGEPEPTVAIAPAGASSPEALVERLRAYPTNGMSDLVQLAHPDQRAAVAYLFAVVPVSFSMLGVTMNEDLDAGEKEAFAEDVQAFLASHGLKAASDRLDALKERDPAQLSDAERLAAFNEALDGVDLIAAVDASWRLLSRANELSGGEGKTPGMLDPNLFQVEAASLEVDGDAATVSSGAGQRLRLQKEADGRWYVDFAGSELLGR